MREEREGKEEEGNIGNRERICRGRKWEIRINLSEWHKHMKNMRGEEVKKIEEEERYGQKEKGGRKKSKGKTNSKSTK